MQWLAMLTMLVDHVGMIFYPAEPIWRIVGRLAFPIYAFLIVRGLERTRNRKNYVIRLAGIGAAAQLAFFVLDMYRPNVIFTFLAAVGVFLVLDWIGSRFHAWGLVVIAGMVFEVLNLEYGAYALFLMLGYRYLQGWALITYHSALSVLFVPFLGVIQIFALISTVLIILLPELEKIKSPRWLWRAFYPAHLFLLAFITLDFTAYR